MCGQRKQIKSLHIALLLCLKNNAEFRQSKSTPTKLSKYHIRHRKSLTVSDRHAAANIRKKRNHNSLDQQIVHSNPISYCPQELSREE